MRLLLKYVANSTTFVESLDQDVDFIAILIQFKRYKQAASQGEREARQFFSFHGLANNLFTISAIYCAQKLPHPS